MNPSAAKFKEIFTVLYREDGNERDRIIFSCVTAVAEALEALEAKMNHGVVPAIGAIAQQLKDSTPLGAPAVAPAPTASGEEELPPPVRATTTASAPAAPPSSPVTVSHATVPVSQIVSTSAAANGGTGARS